LKQKGIESNLSDLISEISERDKRDSQRSVAPLIPAEDALVLDSSDLGIEAVYERIMTLCGGV
jgi:cytidylate kinase